MLTLINAHCIQHFPMMGDEGCCGDMLMSTGTRGSLVVRQFETEAIVFEPFGNITGASD